MSTGDRIPLSWGDQAAAYLMGMWGMKPPACLAVGSIRRRRHDVGDLEIIAPMPELVHQDALFDTIDRTMETKGLFGDQTVPFCRALKGFRKGFLYTSLQADLTHEGGRAITLAVQIHRYAADGSNRGWIELMRTGPGEFGKYFLQCWKQRRHIRPESHASIDGHLVDRDGGRVETPTEASCFELCRLPYIEPADRDGFIANVLRSQGLERKEQLR